MNLYVIHLRYGFDWRIPGDPPDTGREDWRRQYLVRATCDEAAKELATHAVRTEVDRQHVMPAGHTTPVALETSNHESDVLLCARAEHDMAVCMRVMPTSRSCRIEHLRRIVENDAAGTIDGHQVGVVDAAIVLHSFDTAARLCEWINAGDIAGIVRRCNQAAADKRDADLGTMADRHETAAELLATEPPPASEGLV